MKGTAGIDTSMVAFDGRTIISSRGRRSAADCAPLMICNNTGTFSSYGQLGSCVRDRARMVPGHRVFREWISLRSGRSGRCASPSAASRVICTDVPCRFAHNASSLVCSRGARGCARVREGARGFARVREGVQEGGRAYTRAQSPTGGRTMADTAIQAARLTPQRVVLIWQAVARIATRASGAQAHAQCTQRPMASGR